MITLSLATCLLEMVFLRTLQVQTEKRDHLDHEPLQRLSMEGKPFLVNTCMSWIPQYSSSYFDLQEAPYIMLSIIFMM